MHIDWPFRGILSCVVFITCIPTPLGQRNDTTFCISSTDDLGFNPPFSQTPFNLYYCYNDLSYSFYFAADINFGFALHNLRHLYTFLGPVLLVQRDGITGLFANDSTAFKWKLCCHCLKCLWQCHVATGSCFYAAVCSLPSTNALSLSLSSSRRRQITTWPGYRWVTWIWRHGPLARYVKLRVRMRRECRERFPRHRRWAIPTCITARASRTCRDACRDRQLSVSFEIGGGGKRSRHSRRMHNLQFYVSGKRPIRSIHKHV